MFDARQLNIRDKNGRLLCPACGFPGYANDVAYDEIGGLIGSAICPCCFWEPGFDDDQHASGVAKDTIIDSLRAYRAAWGRTFHWRGRVAVKPLAWDGEQQLADLFELAPNLR
ncbi:hypothetical protein [Shinella kummerowiae]|uniref:hypothetical protein n=1 Tax=Shinella kummerowiae TaxID=417745 RepID=UPI0021B65AD4|nr:hypothetical protein [Shinella kummerowiae]MCT7667304.1 hypothetical protein [Shinella kummerowiae]